MAAAMADLPARLAAIKDRGTLRITTRGRRTGKPHTVTIWFVVDGATLYLATLNAKRDWVRNLRKTPDAALEVESVAEVKRMLDARGIRYLDFGGPQLWIRDPDGNVVELCEPR